jgi:hypothetical protein
MELSGSISAICRARQKHVHVPLFTVRQHVVRLEILVATNKEANKLPNIFQIVTLANKRQV